MNRVKPKSHALELADVPVNGEYKQKRNVTCVFKGIGKILKTQVTTIDYDTWGNLYAKIGKIEFVNCFVKCDAGEGWAGEGALVPITSLPNS